MPRFFGMPKLGMNMTQGTITSWLVREGETIEAGQLIVDVETDKAVQSVESPASGILAKIMKREGEQVPCMTVIAVILAPGETLPDSIPTEVADGVRPRAEVEVTVQQGPGAEAKTGQTTERILVSPSAKALAADLGIDIHKIPYTGTRISRKDVEEAYQAQQQQGSPPPAAGLGATGSGQGLTRRPLTHMRKLTAEHMSQSARNVARVGLTVDADATALIAWRGKLQGGGVEAGYSELLAKLVGYALREFPYMNAQLGENEIHEMEAVNIGIAVDSERGLLVPVLRNVDKKGMAQLHQEFAALAERARRGRSTVEDLSGGTFTISNLGMYEIEQFLPVINYPECAILGVGAIVHKPVVVATGDIASRSMMTLTLAFDHRLVDGAPAARFFQRLKHLIEAPPDLEERP